MTELKKYLNERGLREVWDVINGQNSVIVAKIKDIQKRTTVGLYADSTAGWKKNESKISEAGAIYIYTDAETFNGKVSAKVKIGDGTSSLAQLSFIDAPYSAHIADKNIHTTAAERTKWNNGISNLQSSVSEVKSTADTAAEDIVKINTTVKGQGTQISTIQGQISQKIWQDDITYAVNRISIGGTNHLIRTGDNSDIIYGSTTATTKVEKRDGGIVRFNGTGAAYSGIYYKMPDMITVNGSNFSSPMCGNEFVFSCDIRCANTATGFLSALQFGIFGTNDGKTYKRIKYYSPQSIKYDSVSGINSTTWSRFISGVITVPELTDWTDQGVTDTYTTYIMAFGFTPSSGLATGSWFDVRCCKMESGNKATDWCPAPDDAEFEIAALKTRCSTIEQTAEGISQTVTNVQTNLSNNYSTTTQMQSAINTKAEEINLSVKQSIDGISIGTRNLVLNSSGNLGNTSNWSPTTELAVSIRTDDGIYGQNSIHLVPPKGASSRSMLRQTVIDRLGISNMTNVTLSFWYRASSASTSSGVGAFLRLTDDSGGFKDVLLSTGKLTLDWKWRKYTVTADLSQYAGTYTGAILHLCAQGGSIRYSCIKLESGNKPSDWTPAPEDSDTKFSLVQTQIGSKVDKNDYNQIISMINLATDDITLGGGSRINITTANNMLISAGNFQLDNSGNITANNATLSGDLTSAYQGFKTTVKPAVIELFNGDNPLTSIHPMSGQHGWKTCLISEQNGTGIIFGQRVENNGVTTYYQIDTNGSYDTYRHRFFGQIITDSNLTISKGQLYIDNIRAIGQASGNLLVGQTGTVLHLYGSSILSNGTAVTSDRRMKNSITDIDEKYLHLLDVLSAKTFRYNQHRPEIQNCGFIAQDVLSALDDVGLTAKEFGGFVDVNGDGSEFALDYSQFIPILWAAVQDIKSKLNGNA